MSESNGMIRMVADHGMDEVIDLRAQATALRQKAMELDIRATVLSAMHHTAASHVTPGTLGREA